MHLRLANFGYSVTGMDLSDILLDEAHRHDEDGLVEWVKGDMRELPFEAGMF